MITILRLLSLLTYGLYNPYINVDKQLDLDKIFTSDWSFLRSINLSFKIWTLSEYLLPVYPKSLLRR